MEKTKLKNRGKEGSDDNLFDNSGILKKINNAISDFSFLMERGYSEKSSKEIIGNRYKLNLRQMRAVNGMSASNSDLKTRFKNEITHSELTDKTVFIDGFNLIIILESILSNAYIFKGRDNCYRDLSGVFGSYKRVLQTEKAITIVGDFLFNSNVKKVIWVLDQPVSNSGRMKTILGKIAQTKNYPWEIILDFNPDKYLVHSKGICISSDAWILNNCSTWFNLIEALFKNDKISSNTIIKYTDNE